MSTDGTGTEFIKKVDMVLEAKAKKRINFNDPKIWGSGLALLAFFGITSFAQLLDMAGGATQAELDETNAQVEINRKLLRKQCRFWAGLHKEDWRDVCRNRESESE